MKRFYLILDLKDVVANTSFVNGLKNGQFKFSLANQKETSLAEALKNVADFMRAMEICTEVLDDCNAPNPWARSVIVFLEILEI